MSRDRFRLLRPVVQVPLYLLEGVLTLVEFVQNALLRLVFRPEYRRGGSCRRTGQCCRAIGIELPASWFDRPRLLALVRAWHDLRYNFEYQGRQDNMLVYACRYVTKDNICSIHRFKPKLCRDFPVTPLRGFTKLHKGCGYFFEKRAGKDFGAVLRGRGRS